MATRKRSKSKRSRKQSKAARSKAAKLGHARRRARERDTDQVIVDRALTPRRHSIGKTFVDKSDFKKIQSTTKRRHPDAKKVRWIAKLGLLDKRGEPTGEEITISISYPPTGMPIAEQYDLALMNIIDYLDELQQRYQGYVLLALWQEVGL